MATEAERTPFTNALLTHMRVLDACRDSKIWIDDQNFSSAQEAWLNTDEPFWMLWLYAADGVSSETTALLKLSLHLLESYTPVELNDPHRDLFMSIHDTLSNLISGKHIDLVATNTLVETLRLLFKTYETVSPDYYIVYMHYYASQGCTEGRYDDPKFLSDSVSCMFSTLSSLATNYGIGTGSYTEYCDIIRRFLPTPPVSVINSVNELLKNPDLPYYYVEDDNDWDDDHDDYDDEDDYDDDYDDDERLD